MDKMKQEVKSKLTYWERLCALFTILMATNIWNSFRPISGGDNFIDGIFSMRGDKSHTVQEDSEK